MPVECRRFEELDAAFWSYGVGAFRWTEVAVGDEVYRALAILCRSSGWHGYLTRGELDEA